jgi:hypothetical protein
LNLLAREQAFNIIGTIAANLCRKRLDEKIPLF